VGSRSLLGFNAKTEEYNYKFMGGEDDARMRSCRALAEVRCNTRRWRGACPEDWEARHIYILEANPRPGHVNAIDSRTLIN